MGGGCYSGGGLIYKQLFFRQRTKELNWLTLTGDNPIATDPSPTDESVGRDPVARGKGERLGRREGGGKEWGWRLHFTWFWMVGSNGANPLHSLFIRRLFPFLLTLYNLKYGPV